MLQAGKIVRANGCTAMVTGRVAAPYLSATGLSRADDDLCSVVQLGAHLRPMLKGFHKQDESAHGI